MAELSVLQPADGKAARCWCMAGSGMRVAGGGPRTLGTSWVPGELRGSPGSGPRACGSFTGSKDVSRGGLGPDAACCLLQPSLCRTSVVSPCSVNYSVPTSMSGSTCKSPGVWEQSSEQALPCPKCLLWRQSWFLCGASYALPLGKGW